MSNHLDRSAAKLDEWAIKQRSQDPSVASVAYVAPWPTVREEALHGLAGEFVRLVQPHSEADPAALLIQFLIALGNVIGRGPFFRVEADRHGTNLFAVIVGDTSKGRKGTSWGHIKKVLGEVESDWINRIRSGVSSGEGIVFQVRDTVARTDADGNEEVVDEGEPDKRLLLLEPEFANVLKVGNRQGNTVSTITRDAWDQDVLSPLTKNSRIIATNPHVSIIGHITKNELLRLLTETEAANGFGNRFLWVCARRSKLLPRGGSLNESDLEPLVGRVREAVELARRVGEIRRTEETWRDWERMYGPLSEGKPGLLGAMIGRAEAQVTRLSLLYAALDRSEVIRPEHQAAAVAVWDYCEESAKYIFGDALGDPVADEILHALRSSPDGLSRTEIRDHFKRHKSKEQVGRALDLLSRQGLATCKAIETRGRPAEVWYATRDKSDRSDKRSD